MVVFFFLLLRQPIDDDDSYFLSFSLNKVLFRMLIPHFLRWIPPFLRLILIFSGPKLFLSFLSLPMRYLEDVSSFQVSSSTSGMSPIQRYLWFSAKLPGWRTFSPVSTQQPFCQNFLVSQVTSKAAPTSCPGKMAAAQTCPVRTSPHEVMLCSGAVALCLVSGSQLKATRTCSP